MVETLAVLMPQTINDPLSLELTQYMVTYVLALELEKVKPKNHPRRETARCAKLAKYLTPLGAPPFHRLHLPSGRGDFPAGR